MFEIEPVTLLMSCLLMCAFSVPFIYNGQKNKKITKALMAKLVELAKFQGANPTEIESWRFRYALGLDVKHNVLTYLRQDTESLSYNLNLSEFKAVKLIKKYQEVNGKPQTQKLPEYVALELIPVASGAQMISLEIYDGELYSDLMGETVIAEKWVGILNKQLN
tara:strand:- start:163939 stop:164430 length:492 start_codon:yes stop_codon:yes gene_type:complete